MRRPRSCKKRSWPSRTSSSQILRGGCSCRQSGCAQISRGALRKSCMRASFLRQGLNYGGCYVCESLDLVGDPFLVSSPDDGGYSIQCVITRRKIFDVAVIAGEY